MRISEMLGAPDRSECKVRPETDALTELGALVECALLRVSLDVTSGDLRLLFDCRGALQIEGGNVAVVVVREVTELAWRTAPRKGWTWQAVTGWEPRVSGDALEITMGLAPDAELRVAGSGGEFYIGYVPGGDAPPPDFTSATTAEIREGLASWSSEIVVVGVTSTTWSSGTSSGCRP